MNIYFSGLGGVGIGPLAGIAHDAGFTVMGSDLRETPVTHELRNRGVYVDIGQDGTFLESCHHAAPIDWFVYTSSLPNDHPELIRARELGIRTSKRDEFLAWFIKKYNLKLIAVAGTHGKTTTTGMLVWLFKELGIPASHSVGTTLSFAPSGVFTPKSTYFIYECDEYDRNFLHFFPKVSLMTSIDYDHPDIFETEEAYRDAFAQFVAQSAHTIAWADDLHKLTLGHEESTWSLGNNEVKQLSLAGAHNRRNGTLALKLLEYLHLITDSAPTILEQFPGTHRRFERLANNLYSDYGHHPVEIEATLQMARELSDDVVLVYQPHQNQRQHQVRDQYTDAFVGASKVYWLPTYLTREDPSLETLSPQELTQRISNRNDITIADLDDALWRNITKARESGALVLCMGAGTIDEWVRKQLTRP